MANRERAENDPKRKVDNRQMPTKKPQPARSVGETGKDPTKGLTPPYAAAMRKNKPKGK